MSMRTKNSILNIITAVGFSLIVGLLSMFRLKFFVDYFGNEVNGFFSLSNSVSLAITFVEAGMGSIFIQKLYLLLANSDQKAITDLYLTVKRIAKIITMLIFCLALGYSFIHINKYSYLFGLNKTILIYWLFLIPTVFSYYLRVPAYVLMADQKEYIVSFVGQLGNVLSYLIQILMLVFMRNLDITYISVIMFAFSVGPLIINHEIALNKYPYLRSHKGSFKFDKDVIYKMKDCLMGSISNAIMQSVDTLMLAYVSTASNNFKLSLISVISIYNGIILLVKNIVQGFVAQVIASFGNAAHSDQQKFRYLYLAYIKVSFALCVAIFACLFGVINKFNLIFYDMGDSLLPTSFVLVIVTNALLDIIKIPLLAAPVNIQGDYKFSRNVTSFEAIANIALSYILLQLMGEIGLFVATLIVQLVSVVILIPRKCYSLLHEKYSNYLIIFVKYCLLFLIIGWVNYIAMQNISVPTLISFFIAAILLFGMDFSFVMFVSFGMYDDFTYVFETLTNKILRGNS